MSPIAQFQCIDISFCSNPITHALQVITCVWLLSFSPGIAVRVGQLDGHLVTALASTLKTSKKDKVIRVALAALRVCLRLLSEYPYLAIAVVPSTISAFQLLSIRADVNVNSSIRPLFVLVSQLLSHLLIWLGLCRILLRRVVARRMKAGLRHRASTAAP